MLRDAATQRASLAESQQRANLQVLRDVTREAAVRLVELAPPVCSQHRQRAQCLALAETRQVQRVHRGVTVAAAKTRVVTMQSPVPVPSRTREQVPVLS